MMEGLTKQQIGKCGELLVQYRLLTWGIESSSLTTDTGVDLVAFDKVEPSIVKIEVKTNQSKGKNWVEWRIRNNIPAEYIACVDITREKFWLMKKEDFINKAVSSGQKWRLWWYLPGQRGKRDRGLEEESFAQDESEKAIPQIFKGAKRIPTKR
jgi:hypothetical protein